MDWQFKVGLGIAFVFGLLPFAVKDMPHWITWPGISIGALFVLWGLFPGHDKIPLWPTLVFIVSIAGVIGSAIGYIENEKSDKKPFFYLRRTTLIL